MDFSIKINKKNRESFLVKKGDKKSTKTGRKWGEKI